MTTFESVTLEAEHVPETHRTLNNDHTVTEETLPGAVNVYLVIDGARLLFTQYKAGKVFDALDAAKAAQPAPEQSQQSAPQESPPQQV